MDKYIIIQMYSLEHIQKYKGILYDLSYFAKADLPSNSKGTHILEKIRVGELIYLCLSCKNFEKFCLK